MDFQEFQETWPEDMEGYNRSNKFKLEMLEKERKTLPTGRWLWFGVPIVLGVVRAAEGTWGVAFGVAGLLITFELVDLLSRILRDLNEIKRQIEMVKGSARENRWAIHWCHGVAMKVQRKDPIGHSLD